MTSKHLPASPPTTQDRDLGMVRGMGWFFSVLAILVWVGQLWEQSRPERIVNAVAGALLLLVGGLLVWGRWKKSGVRSAAS